MRVHSKAFAAIFFLIASTLLAGCLGGDEEVDPTANVEAVEPLQTQIRLPDDDEDAWFAPGESVAVEAVEPENAEGNVTYTWAIQEDPFTIFTSSDAIDTGELLPGESGDLTFDEPGFYEFGHCDPHPWMSHTVAVLEDYDGPDHLTIYILEDDLQDQDSYVFSQQHITIGVGTTVTYENIGDVMHTASVAHEGEAVPVPRELGLTEAQGEVTLEGDGWMNLLVFAEDDAGNGGWAKEQIYVRERFEDYSETNTGSFDAAHEQVADEDSFDHTFEWSGTVTLNVTLTNEPFNAVQQIDVNLYELDSAGERNATIISENATASDSFSADFDASTPPIPRDYELVVAAAQGALIDYEVDVHVAYDHTPPVLTQLPCPEPHYSLGHC